MIKTANRNSTLEAKKLLDFIVSVAEKKIIAGQHTQTIPMEEIAYLKKVTGMEPMLRGFELLSYSPNINYEDADSACLVEVEENKGTAEAALEWAVKNRASDLKCILTFSFHWFSPVGGRDKSFYAKNTDFDPEKVLVEGTRERCAFFRDMDSIALILEKFRDNNIPVLWRPFHESYGNWFWWGSRGPEVACSLYRLMFDYFVGVKHLDNLLWVWNCDVAAAYPGDEYVDVNSIDVYLEEKKATDYSENYRRLVDACGTNKPVALAEVGYVPDVELLEKSGIPWAYFMTWSKEFAMDGVRNTQEELKKLYESNYTLKLS